MPNLSRFSDLYRYFPFVLASRLALCESVRCIFDAHRKTTYSLFGEDQLLVKYLPLAPTGFYVDVGCNHPLTHSNTALFYSYGWRGLVIDGNQDLINLYPKFRPRDTALCEVVSDSVKNMTFMVSRNHELSTVSPEFAAGRISESDMVSQRIVETTTLQKIFEAHAVPQRFELLSIDVEDHDYQVLTSFDICAYRPKVILIEMAYFMPGEPSASRIVQYLREHDYSMRAYTSLNGLFIDLNWAEPHSTAPARP